VHRELRVQLHTLNMHLGPRFSRKLQDLTRLAGHRAPNVARDSLIQPIILVRRARPLIGLDGFLKHVDGEGPWLLSGYRSSDRLYFCRRILTRPFGGHDTKGTSSACVSAKVYERPGSWRRFTSVQDLPVNCLSDPCALRVMEVRKERLSAKSAASLKSRSHDKRDKGATAD